MQEKIGVQLQLLINIYFSSIVCPWFPLFKTRPVAIEILQFKVEFSHKTVNCNTTMVINMASRSETKTVKMSSLMENVIKSNKEINKVALTSLFLIR